MYGDIQHWHQLQKKFMPGLSSLQSPTASQCLSKVALSHSSELKLDWTELQVNSTELFHKLCLGKLSIVLFYSSLNALSNLWWSIFKFPVFPSPFPSHLSNMTSSLGRVERIKTGVLELGRVQYSCHFVNLILCTPSPQIKTKTFWGKWQKEEGVQTKERLSI